VSAAWSAEQRRILAALGHTLYRPANVPVAVVPGGPLASALLRAAGLDPATTDFEAWLRAQRLPSLASLRADPTAKRALWPRLRALRRGGTGR
jgi:hypothetical protein